MNENDKNFSKHENISKIKVKCTLVQALSFCTGCRVHRGSRGIAILYRH